MAKAGILVRHALPGVGNTSPACPAKRAREAGWRRECQSILIDVQAVFHSIRWKPTVLATTPCTHLWVLGSARLVSACPPIVLQNTRRPMEGDASDICLSRLQGYTNTCGALMPDARRDAGFVQHHRRPRPSATSPPHDCNGSATPPPWHGA